ncbi:MAG TPA: outer membrane beta-barrel protein [Candidatus Elarobacter sp.]|nr:outer membrane beta-barrel protein [Candidatus Elarobacter sp.]
MALVACAAAPAFAQRSTHIGVGGGISAPVGRIDSTYTSGRQGMVVLTTGPSEGPFGLRLDYSYNALRGKTVNGVRIPDTHYDAVTANLVGEFRVANVKPYALGGVGGYSHRPVPGGKRVTNLGYNGGAGITFPIATLPVSGFLETRYTVVAPRNAPTEHLLPVTLGVMF